MRVAVLGPINWRTPPRHYGPWELVVYNLVEGLQKRGVEVTLFATGDSQVSCDLRWVCPRPLAEEPSLDYKVYEYLHVGHALERAREFDLIHNHLNCYPLCFSPLITTPIVTTLHGSAYLEPATHIIYRRFRQLPYVSISNAEREGLPELNYVATVYNGIDLNQFTFRDAPGRYLLFLGRISPKKGTHLAIEVARRTGHRLVIAGWVPPDEGPYFENVVKPRLGNGVEYIGPVEPGPRDRVLGNALALLHLPTVPEPFGLVLAEAQACGTPVIGFDRGSVREVVEDGVTGYVVKDLEEAVDAVSRLDTIRRQDCRRRAETHFSADKMVESYLGVYRLVLGPGEPRAATSRETRRRSPPSAGTAPHRCQTGPEPYPRSG